MSNEVDEVVMRCRGLSVGIIRVLNIFKKIGQREHGLGTWCGTANRISPLQYYPTLWNLSVLVHLKIFLIL